MSDHPTVAQLIAVHGGRPHAALFGKGPSFEAVPWEDFDRLHGPRIGINEVALAVPGCDFMVAQDRWAQWMDETDLGQFIAVSPLCRTAPAWWSPSRFCPHETRGESDRERVADRAWWIERNAIYQEQGSAVAAIHFCHLLGARRVVLYGFDGGYQHGRRWQTAEHTPLKSIYGAINTCMREIAKECGIELIDDIHNL